MCNAWNHPGDCTCGFGPPYPDVKVRVTKWADPADRNPRNLAELALEFPVPRANFFSDIDREGRSAVLETVGRVLQPVADERFGEGRIKVVPTELRKGSIEVGLLLMMGVGSAYTFFKNYKGLREGVLLFANDIEAISGYLGKLVRKRYSHEEKKARGPKAEERNDDNDRRIAK